MNVLIAIGLGVAIFVGAAVGIALFTAGVALTYGFLIFPLAEWILDGAEDWAARRRGRDCPSRLPTGHQPSPRGDHHE